jgi:PPOX class probable F420-dependent enzyme
MVGVDVGYTDAPPGWWRAFVTADPPRTGKLAVVRADGSPHVAPVWVDLDGDDLVFMTSADTIKGKAIARDPRVATCFDDEQPPFSFVLVRGTVTTSDACINRLTCGSIERTMSCLWHAHSPNDRSGDTPCRASSRLRA